MIITWYLTGWWIPNINFLPALSIFVTPVSCMQIFPKEEIFSYMQHSSRGLRSNCTVHFYLRDEYNYAPLSGLGTSFLRWNQGSASIFIRYPLLSSPEIGIYILSSLYEEWSTRWCLILKFPFLLLLLFLFFFLFFYFYTLPFVDRWRWEVGYREEKLIVLIWLLGIFRLLRMVISLVLWRN